METKTFNGVEFFQDFDRYEGSICMVNPKTIGRYKQLKDEQPNSNDYGIFFAFSKKQYEEGVASLKRRGFIKDESELRSSGHQMVGTPDEIRRFFAFYDERYKKIAEECDPQEVYFYEWNNHECMISMNDDPALEVVASIFGKERAHKVRRVYPGTLVNVLLPLTERDRHLKDCDFELMMLGRLEFDCHGFFSERDCRYHRPDCLWADTIAGQVAEMRRLYDKLPDDIKDASPISREKIDDYAKRFEEWISEEFSKAEYDPVPPTPRSVYEGLEISLGTKSLWYKDDEGRWKHPDHVWFSCDLRRFEGNKESKAGRAFTSYLGKDGTTLTRVYIDSDNYALSWKPYERPEFCDVSCKYDHKPLNKRLYDFYHE